VPPSLVEPLSYAWHRPRGRRSSDHASCADNQGAGSGSSNEVACERLRVQVPRGRVPRRPTRPPVATVRVGERSYESRRPNATWANVGVHMATGAASSRSAFLPVNCSQRVTITSQ
jgi:hypothetical protein